MKANVHIMARMKKLDAQKTLALVIVVIIVDVVVEKPVLPHLPRLMEKLN